MLFLTLSSAQPMIPDFLLVYTRKALCEVKDRHKHRQTICSISPQSQADFMWLLNSILPFLYIFSTQISYMWIIWMHIPYLEKKVIYIFFYANQAKCEILWHLTNGLWQNEQLMTIWRTFCLSRMYTRKCTFIFKHTRTQTLTNSHTLSHTRTHTRGHTYTPKKCSYFCPFCSSLFLLFFITL